MELTDIAGLDDRFAQNLRQKAGIKDSLALANASDTVEKRRALAEKIGEAPSLLYTLAKQADLLRCESITPTVAENLLRAGVRDIRDLGAAHPEKLANYLFDQGIDTQVDEYQMLDWVIAATQVASGFEPDAADQGNPALFRQKRTASMAYSNAYGNDLSEIITELGVGIAQAQRQLDEASLGIQQEILADPKMAAYGFNATWYAIPEATFTLKMEYSCSETGEKRISVIPMNATYQNVFKTERAEESTLSLRFVPVPAPDALTQRISMPDLRGLSQAEAEEVLEALGLFAAYRLVPGDVTNGQFTEIVAQSVAAGTQVLQQQPINLNYRTVPEHELVGKLVSVLRARIAALS